MKKYLFGILAIALAIGFSAFTSIKNTKPTTLTRLVFQGSTTTSGSISAKNGANTRFINWAVATPTCTITANQKACVIDVGNDYLDDNDVLLATDPDGAGSKKAFPMSEEIGYISGTTIYYRVDTYDTNDIEVHNARY